MLDIKFYVNSVLRPKENYAVSEPGLVVLQVVGLYLGRNGFTWYQERHVHATPKIDACTAFFAQSKTL